MPDHAADVADLVGETIVDLEAMGCDPLDRAAALISAGLIEAEDADLQDVLELYRMILEQTAATLRALQGGGATLH
jgi:hypothetical protein